MGSRVEVKYEEVWFPSVVTVVNVHGYTVKTTQDDDTQTFASFLDPVCVCVLGACASCVCVCVCVCVVSKALKP